MSLLPAQRRKMTSISQKPDESVAVVEVLSFELMSYGLLEPRRIELGVMDYEKR